jgi:hypothetical protein
MFWFTIVYVIVGILLWIFLGIVELPVRSIVGNPYKVNVNLNRHVFNNTFLVNDTNTNGNVTTWNAYLNWTTETNVTYTTEPIAHELSAASTDILVRFRISFAPFLGSILTILGFLFMAFFGGIGLVSLPWGLIRSYWKRPRRIDEETYKKARVVLNERATALLEVGLAMKVTISLSLRIEKADFSPGIDVIDCNTTNSDRPFSF